MTTPASRTAEAAVTSEAGSATVFVDRGNGANARKQRRRTVAAFAGAFTDLPAGRPPPCPPDSPRPWPSAGSLPGWR